MKYRRMTALLLMVLTGCTVGGRQEETAPVTTEVMQTEAIQTELQTEISSETAPDTTEESSFVHEGDIGYSTDEKYADIVQVLKKRYEYVGDTQGFIYVADDEEIIFSACMDSYERDGVTRANEYTTYEIGSVTKMFTACAVLMLCEQGSIQLDDTLGKFFPEYIDTPAAAITIYQLLHMQSGLYDMDHMMNAYIPEDADEDMKARAKDGKLTDDEFVSLVFAKELKTEPGTIHEYSNTNYKLLALIIEQISGQSFAGYIGENIFDRCGMEHSSISTEGDVTSVPRDTETPYCTYTNFIRGAGDMHSCAADLIAFDRALFAGELLNKSSLDEMFNMDKTYGCGWFIEKAHPEHFMHTGEVGNFLTLSAVYNTKDRGRIYLIELAPNNDHDTLRTLYEIYDALRLGLDK